MSHEQYSKINTTVTSVFIAVHELSDNQRGCFKNDSYKTGIYRVTKENYRRFYNI